MYEYHLSQKAGDDFRHRRNVRRRKKAKALKKLLNQPRSHGSVVGNVRGIPKPRVRACSPVSVMSNRHPARRFGWDDERCIRRNRAHWA